MKKFSVLNENFTEKNPGNALGVTNHYTPVQNIVTNIANLFCVRLSIVATVAEDGLSVKLTSSKFTSPEAINDIINTPLYSDVNYQQSNLNSYIMAQGLTKMSLVNLGGYYVVYFSPADIKGASTTGGECPCCSCPCPCEAKESVLDEFEISQIIKEDEEETEIESEQIKEIIELLNDGDKVKAAKKLDELVAKKMELPDEYYFTGVKFKDGEEAIALRWKYTKKLPHGATVDAVRSLIHIFGSGENAIWVQDFDKESIVKLPDEVKKMIENILEILNAEKTDDPSIFNISDVIKHERDNEENDDDKSDDADSSIEDDNEDDDSRGDKSDE